MEWNESLYIAVISNPGKSIHSRLFLFPEFLREEGFDPDWFYLNVIDMENCIDKTYKFTDLFDAKQRKAFLTLNGEYLPLFIPQCAWCKDIRTTGKEEKDVWTSLPQEQWGALQLPISHGICPKCSELHFGKKA